MRVPPGALPRGARVAAGALGLILWFVALPRPLIGNWRAYTPDSAAYVEASRTFLGGGGFMIRPWGGCEPTMRVPLDLWPPGYPALMAAVQALGVPAPDSGVLVSLLASAVFVVLASWIGSGVLGGVAGVLVPAAIAVMPSVVLQSGMCWSDALCLALSAASLGCLIGGRPDRPGGWRWMALGGLFAGLAWGVRYAGAALIGAEALFLVVTSVAGGRRWRISAVWLLGCAAGTAPFVVRNLAVFGRLVPYDLRPSAGADPSGVALETIEAAAIGLGGGTRYMGDSHFVPGVALTALLAVAVGWVAVESLRRLRGGRARAWVTTHGDATLLGCYAAVYVALVVLARIRYQWGEPVGARHLVQVLWIVWILVAYGVSRLGGERRFPRAGLVCVLGLALVLYLHADRWWAAHANRPVPGVLLSGLADRLVSEVGPERFVLSSEAHVLRIHGVNARQMARDGDPVERCRDSEALWGVVIEDESAARAGAYGPTVRALVEGPDEVPGFRRFGHHPLAFQVVAR